MIGPTDEAEIVLPPANKSRGFSLMHNSLFAIYCHIL